MADAEPSKQDDQEWVGELLQTALITAICLALLPALLIGMLAAELMRAAGLRWTWALPPFLATAAPLAIGREDAAAAVRQAAQRAADGHPDASEIALAGAPWWLAGACLIAAGWKLYRDREDRYHGGERARRQASASGPFGAAAAALARRRSPAAGAYSPRHGVRIGRSLDSGRPVLVEPPRTMVTLIGAAGAGKTTLGTTLSEGLVDHGASLVVLDGKGSRGLALRLRELAARKGRPFSLVSLDPFGVDALDSRRVGWNVVGHGNPTEIKDTILAGEEFAEPYYRTTVERGLLAAASCLAAEQRPACPSSLAALLQSPRELATRLDRAAGERFASEVAWLDDLTKTELSGLRGASSKLVRLLHSEGGDWLDRTEDALDLELAMRTGAVVLFSLPASGYPEHAPQLCRYLTQQVNAVCGRITRAGRPTRAVFWIDDASALAAGQLPALYERAREAGVVVMTAVQSLSNLRTLGGERLLSAALDDAELVAVLRQSVPGAAIELSALAGDEETFVHAHEVGEAHGWLAHSDETGRRTRRLIDRPRVAPQAIKELRTGEAILISKRDGHQVERVRIEAVEGAP